jgi:hypothetical protein
MGSQSDVELYSIVRELRKIGIEIKKLRLVIQASNICTTYGGKENGRKKSDKGN